MGKTTQAWYTLAEQQLQNLTIINLQVFPTYP